jgi:hypothetical protein
MRADVPSSTYEAYGQQSQFQSVGWMAGLHSDGLGHPTGSGVYLGDGWVLTAAHVVEGSINASGFVNLMFGVGPNYYNNWGEYGMADAWYIYPGYSSSAGNGQTPDLALVHLSTSLSVSAAVIYSGTVQGGDTISMVGYGVPGTDSTGPLTYDGEKRGGDNILSGFGSDGSLDYSLYSSSYMFAEFDWLNQMPLECMGSPYDSGGGVFMEGSGQWYLTGIMDFTTGPGTAGLLYGFSTGALDVTQYSGWIDETRADVPEPGTLIMFATGSLALLSRRLLRRKVKEAA